MQTYALGKQTGTLPAPPTSDYHGLVHAIIIAADPNATGKTYFQQVKQQGVAITPATIIAYNTPAAAGGLGQPYEHTACEGNSIDPTEYAIGQSVGGDGIFITYVWL